MNANYKEQRDLIKSLLDRDTIYSYAPDYVDLSVEEMRKDSIVFELDPRTTYILGHTGYLIQKRRNYVFISFESSYLIVHVDK